MRFLLLALFPLAAGCSSAAIDAHAAHDLHDARANADARIVYASCPDHAALGPGCGLITKRVSDDGVRAKFRDMKCQGLGDDACQALFQSSVDQWLSDRYYLADFAAVDAECRRHPGKCDDPVVREEIMLDLHNTRVRAELGRDEHDIEEQRAIDQRRHEEEQRRAIGVGLIVTDLATR